MTQRFEVGDEVEVDMANPHFTYRVTAVHQDGYLTVVNTKTGTEHRRHAPQRLRLVTPAPYVPQVGDVVERTDHPRGDFGGPWTLEELRGGGIWSSISYGSGPPCTWRDEWLRAEVRPGGLARLVSSTGGGSSATAVSGRETCPECGAVGLHACTTRVPLTPRAQPEPRLHNGTCHRGHAAYIGLFAAKCETCDAIAAVEREEPEHVVRVYEGVERVWQAGQNAEHYRHPLRPGAIALWREARVKALHEDGLARAVLLRGGR